QAPMDAIVTATSRSAESLRLGDQVGTIAPGMEADIIAIDGNPLQDITAVRRVTFVMKGGRVVRNGGAGGSHEDEPEDELMKPIRLVAFLLTVFALPSGAASAQSKDDPSLGSW